MKILVIAPHMDDEVLGMGGTIVKHVQRGDAVTVCVCANRAYDHQYRREDIAREEEAARQAQRVLGYSDLRLLRLPDERLDERLVDVIVPLERLCADVRPDVVYLCHRGDPHQDHQAVFKAAIVVCRAVAASAPQRVLCYEVPSSTDQAPPFVEDRFAPNVYVDITSSLELKVRAMQCYERESRPFPHPRSPEGLTAYARRRGLEVGCAAAEAFMLVRDLWR